MRTGNISSVSSLQYPNLSNLEIGARTSVVRAKTALEQRLSEDRLLEISRMLRIVKERLRTHPNIDAWTELEFMQTIEYYEQITQQQSTISNGLRETIESIGAAVRSTII